MSKLVPPICLVLALAMLIMGFAMLAVEAPQPPAELAGARAAGDDDYGDAIEAQVARQRWIRILTLTGLFTGTVVMTVAAFALMRPAEETPA
jgi:hypothetical protein